MLKKAFASLLCGLVLAVSLAVAVTGAQAAQVRGSVLRLHVLANSDSQADQALKLKVRDAVLGTGADMFDGADDRDGAIAACDLDALRQTAAEVIAENGYSYTVTVTLEKVFFPTREYGDYRLPAGEYDAVRVLIGRGEGKNWWCILYPPLCFGGAVRGKKMDDLLSRGDLELVTVDGAPEYEVRFKIAEWLGGLGRERERASK